MASDDPLTVPEVLQMVREAYDEGFLAGYGEAVLGRDDCDHGVRWWEWVAYAVSLVVMAGSIWLILNHPGWVVE